MAPPECFGTRVGLSKASLNVSFLVNEVGRFLRQEKGT